VSVYVYDSVAAINLCVILWS